MFSTAQIMEKAKSPLITSFATIKKPIEDIKTTICKLVCKKNLSLNLIATDLTTRTLIQHKFNELPASSPHTIKEWLLSKSLVLKNQ